jgi:hypothetical protein
MSKSPKPQPRRVSPREAGYLLRPWGCNHYPTYSEIEAYVPITGDFEIIADVHDTKGVDAEVVAGLIARAVNSYEKTHDMIGQMTAAIELCLTCRDRLTWEAEHESESVLKRARQMRKSD